MSDTSHLDQIHHQERMIVEFEKQRPVFLIRPHLAKNGNMWSFLYGDNIQEGICGFGETVAKAAADFDNNWHNEKIKVS